MQTMQICNFIKLEFSHDFGWEDPLSHGGFAKVDGKF